MSSVSHTRTLATQRFAGLLACCQSSKILPIAGSCVKPRLSRAIIEPKVEMSEEDANCLIPYGRILITEYV